MVLLHHHSLARNFPGLKGIDAFAIERKRILISKRESLLGRWGLLAVHLMRDGPGFRGDFGVRRGRSARSGDEPAKPSS
jgi:hypothetical protein